MSHQSGVYVFCAIQENEPKTFGKVLLNGQEHEIYTIHFQNIAMVVSKVIDEVLPNRNNLIAHQQTLSEVMKRYSLIPMSFGNVFNSEEDVLLITGHINEELEKVFSKLENKIELGLKIVAKKEWIDHEMSQDPIIKKWRTAQKDFTDPASFYEQIHLGEQARNFVLQLEKEVERQIYDSLMELAEAGKINQTIPGKTLLNAAFLVHCDREEAFDQRVNDLFELWKEKVEFKYSGPWPAYNFVDIRLRIEGK
ncbi:GvpL/GvpF family gas vesicle protein [Paenibacillus sp. BSR1-1]|uniref:GvpL/GvpF family gas vesicle protein n=1 Tax=Paenibacillus sp. BSR1-1 TaxID=3020845 RepID=UPI0025B096BC|nr:GvpL/GvpF family gas vesicle protein [Paenibacillus sp. BSR1-1]MDN3015353.1 GvpL/GvpF family gas vesicle protein [Paenibacillus sp. BSR1-1]